MNRNTMTAEITTTIESGIADPADYDIDAIATALHNLTGSWNMGLVSAHDFWETVEDHAIN